MTPPAVNHNWVVFMAVLLLKDKTEDELRELSGLLDTEEKRQKYADDLWKLLDDTIEKPQKEVTPEVIREVTNRMYSSIQRKLQRA